ncbi:preprotein translocase subunit SecE [Haloechinothrix sp. LS1_15]|uniref:preprotein translocase subunit SecE n=1 Tax=Haloechinothrix sp. LS1_15 TaxID=2652248 RepID=UPI0029465648|nr:preprotein translocase subunit SecE [Haloechinothrix sp. LS1_15]MDV6013160.1 preprotein translocase subunit SecE [Haloechinothrix sp. LS1_15]
MSDDGDKDKEGGEKRPSRPDNAAARRERRASAGSGDRGRANSRRSSSGAGSSGNREDSSAKPGTIEEQPPIHQRVARFSREVLGELRKVVWPTRKQMSTYTIVVLAFMAFMIALVWALDLLFAEVVFTIFG